MISSLPLTAFEETTETAYGDPYLQHKYSPTYLAQSIEYCTIMGIVQ